MKDIRFTIFLLFIFVTNILVADSGNLSSEIIQNAKKECASFERGTFSLSESAVTLNDITGDGNPEQIVDASQFACSTALTLWGGTGGTLLWIIVDQKVYEFLAHKWQIVNFDGQKVLLLAVHSSQCGDKIGPCYRAYIWSDGFRTTKSI